MRELREAGVELGGEPDTIAGGSTRMRGIYEPYVNALGRAPGAARCRRGWRRSRLPTTGGLPPGISAPVVSLQTRRFARASDIDTTCAWRGAELARVSMVTRIDLLKEARECLSGDGGV